MPIKLSLILLPCTLTGPKHWSVTHFNLSQTSRILVPIEFSLIFTSLHPPHPKHWSAAYFDLSQTSRILELMELILSDPCSLVVTCWERAGLLALLNVMFSLFCYFPIWCHRSGVVFDLSLSDLCLLPYFC